jgi:hydrogenase expression/formation protein HypD
MTTAGIQIDGFILPGHVSVIIGVNAYRPFFERYQIPSVVAGFEPADILQAIAKMVAQIENGRPELENVYPRAVTSEGNTKARKIMEDIFEPADVCWRGIGLIPQSGLKIRETYAAHDAQKIFSITVPDSKEPQGCACGEVLTGLKTPPECALYKKICTPIDPVGPCMVSTEGTCAAYYKYHV